jgi:hypothetical protein
VLPPAELAQKMRLASCCHKVWPSHRLVAEGSALPSVVFHGLKGHAVFSVLPPRIIDACFFRCSRRKARCSRHASQNGPRCAPRARRSANGVLRSGLFRVGRLLYKAGLPPPICRPYAPELNPVEYIWGYWKQHELPNVCPRDYWQLNQTARRTLRRMPRRPRLITAFLQQAFSWPEWPYIMRDSIGKSKRPPTDPSRLLTWKGSAVLVCTLM